MTNIARVISIKFWLPLLVTTLAVAVWAMMTWNEYALLKRNLIEDSREHIKHDMEALQREIETELRSGNFAEAEQAITVRGVNNRYALLMLVDDTGRIRYSTRLAYKGQSAGKLVPEFDDAAFQQVIQSRQISIALVEEDHCFLAYYPVMLERQPDELRPGRTGAVFLKYDFERDTAAIYDELLRSSLVIAVLLIAALVVFFIFHARFIDRPIRQLVATTQRLAKGDFGAVSKIHGSGELAVLAKAINDMSQQLQEHTVQRDNAVKALRDKEQWQQKLLNTLPVGVQECDVEGVITYSNAAHHRMLGLNNTELIGRHVWDFQPDEQTKKETIDYLAYLKREQPEPSAFITQNITADGREITVQIIWDYLRDEQGAVSGFISIVSDISDRIAAERKYSALFEQSADAHLLIDDNRFVDCNQAALDMLGYDDKSELFNTHPSELSPATQPDGRSSQEKADDMIAQALQQGSHRFRWIHKRRNGENFPVEVLLTVVPFGERKLLHVVWRDLTEKEQVEEALRRSQKMEAIGQLTGGIAHDFNNILGIIIGNISLLETQQPTDPKLQKRIDAIKHSAERAVELTRQLLGFSRRASAATETVVLNDVVSNMCTLLQQSLTPQIELQLQLEEGLWHTDINKGDLEDALLNLALNARDAVQGKGKLTIETHNSTLDEDYCKLNPGVSAGEYVQLTVSDNGEGIPRDLQARIFEPFFTTKEQGKGTGLGLAMVFGFVKRSGGHIKLYSEPGIGTTFRIYLPRATQPGEQKTQQPERTKAYLGNETILVVDDEPDLLSLVEESLQLKGYHVITAASADEALTKLEQHPEIDLLFSDVVMPGTMNGYELAEKASQLYPALKILLSSGYTETAIARNGQARFNASLLTKPYTQQELAARIREMLSE